FDVGCELKGYHASVARTAVLGSPASPQEALHGALQAGLEAAIGAVRPGAAGSRVCEAAVAAVRDAGQPGDECAEVGHGVGLDPAEQPLLRAEAATPLELAEVLRVEVSCYEIGAIGVGAAQTVLVTSDGARALNRSHPGLVVLD